MAPLALVALLACTGAARAQVLVPDGFQDQLVIGGLSAPVGMAWLPDGRLLVIEQKLARIRLLVNGAFAATDPIGTIDNVHTVHPEQGLLGIAVDPGWPARPYIYVHCDNLGTSTIRVSRYTVTGDLNFSGNGALAISTSSRFDLINDIPDVEGNHNGGTLRFGPDGMLYGSFGDDAQGCPAQTPGLRGVILRMDVTRLPSGPGGPPPRALIVPAGNPFPAVPDSNALLVWAYGLRNPFRFGIDPANGALWIGDVGESRREEVDYAPAGGLNFGWPHYEGSLDLDTGCPTQNPVFPVTEYARAEGQSVIGCGIYRRPAGATSAGFPASYAGDGFFGDYYTGFLRRMQRDGASWRLADPEPGQPSASNWGSGFTFVSDWQFGPEGALWYVRQLGQIRRVIAVAGPDTMPVDTLPQVAASFERPFPIPARGEVNLRYTLARPSMVSLRIYDTRGAVVRTLVDGVQNATTYDVLWFGIDDRGEFVPQGVYYARLIVAGRDETRMIPFLR
jgi:glucose/arabinose dehydrogenase